MYLYCKQQTGNALDVPPTCRTCACVFICVCIYIYVYVCVYQAEQWLVDLQMSHPFFSIKNIFNSNSVCFFFCWINFILIRCFILTTGNKPQKKTGSCRFPVCLLTSDLRPLYISWSFTQWRPPGRSLPSLKYNYFTSCRRVCVQICFLVNKFQ